MCNRFSIPPSMNRLPGLRFFITSEHSEEQIRYTVERTAAHLAEM